MNTVRLITDSASDITLEQERDLDIKIMSHSFTIGDRTYTSRHDINNSEFYKLLDGCENVPGMTQIPTEEWLRTYEEFSKVEGVTDIMVVVTSARGSHSCDNALIAKTNYYLKYPKQRGDFNIHVYDSAAYSGIFGYAITQAAAKAKAGADIHEVRAILNDWLSNAYALLFCQDLKYAKKSPVLSSVSNLRGEMLGIKPIIKIFRAHPEIIKKVRGGKRVASSIASIAKGDMIPKTPYIIIWGSDENLRDQMAAAMEKTLGYPPAEFCQVGAEVACNSGHQIMGVVIKGKTNFFERHYQY